MRAETADSVLRSITDGVIAIDRGAHVTFMNVAAEALTGIAARDAVGRPVTEIVRLLDAEPVSAIDRVLAHRTPARIEAARLAPAAGDHRMVSALVSPIVDDDQVTGAVMVVRDITDQKLLELTDRLSSLETVAANVAHEVKTPLAVVVANAVLVRDTLDRIGAGRSAPEDLTRTIEAMAELDDGASQIARVMSQLQALSRPRPRPAAYADVAAVIEGAVRATADEFRHRAEVFANVATVPQVKLDSARLEKVLVNLLTNAAHAIAPGASTDHSVAIAARAQDDAVVIEVRDTGCGMPPNVMKQVFDPFFTTKPVGRGTGLGLAICHGIVSSVGGRFEVESQVGEGSTFRVVLPARRQTVPPPVHRRVRILAIDDEPLTLKVVTRILRGHEPVCVGDPREALALLDRGERFDAIICDMNMPQMTGMEFYEHIRDSHPRDAGRIVFVTGDTTSPRVAQFLAAVPNARLEKPLTPESLRAFIQIVVEDAVIGDLAHDS